MLQSHLFWSSFQGKTIADRYVLGHILGTKAESAVYQTETGEQHPAVIKIRFAERPAEHRECGDWLAAGEVSHPNLIRVFVAGTSELDGFPVDYIVMERADEVLGDILADRALTEPETREMLKSAIPVIRFLHQKGLLHGKLRPSNVMAAGETLKLSADNLRRTGSSPCKDAFSSFDAPEAHENPASVASESWSLGALILKCLTQQTPAAAEVEAALTGLESPWLDIVKHTLLADPQQRWSLGQIEESINGDIVASSPTPKAPVEAALANDIHLRYVERRVAPGPVETERPAPASRLRTLWRWPAIAVGIAIAAVLLGLLLWFKQKPEQAASRTVPPVHQPAAQPLVAAAPQVTPVPRPRVPAPPVPRAISTEVHGKMSGNWYVVVATYTAGGAAEKRARAITLRWPKFRASVFEPPVRDPHHLVVIGSGLSENEAESLRKRARASGLPQDVYIKRFGPRAKSADGQ